MVYQRRNIERVTVTNQDGTSAELWEYEERALTHEEYYAIIGKNTLENAARLEEIDETSTTELLAVTDLYEQLIEKGVL